MSKILLLEDDPILGQAIKLQLEVEKYEVIWKTKIIDAKKEITSNQILQNKFDLFLFDVNLPDGDGFHFASELRGQQILIPIIFLTARSDEESLVLGFNNGGNDYIRKPFGKKEFLARIRNQLSEKRTAEDILRYYELVLVRNKQILNFQDQSFTLNRREFEILTIFFEQPESIISREMILSKLAAGDELFDRTIDSHICHIRNKFKKHGITSYRLSSVYGSGYQLERFKDKL